MKNKKILLTNGRLWSALAITRVFGKMGYQVDIVDHHPHAIARYSRYCHHFYQSPSVTNAPQAFAQFVTSLVKQNSYEFVVPVFEEVFVLSRFKEELGKYTKILMNDFELYMMLHNKNRLDLFCHENNISTPTTYRLNNHTAIENFPVFLKEPLSCSSAGVQKISNKQELWQVLHSLEGKTHADPSLIPFIQKGICGYQIATQAVYREGAMCALHMYKNIVEYPPGSGTGVVRESIFHEGIQKVMEKLGRLLRYNGFLGLDFLIEEKTNRFYLIDANPRCPLGFFNSWISGAELAEAYVHAIHGENIPLKTYQEGLKTRFLLSHVYWFFSTWLNGKQSLWSVFKTYWKDRKNSFPEVWDWNDLKPAALLPWIFLKVHFQKGTGIIKKYTNGAIFTPETLQALE